MGGVWLPFITRTSNMFYQLCLTCDEDVKLNLVLISDPIVYAHPFGHAVFRGHLFYFSFEGKYWSIFLRFVSFMYAKICWEKILF